METYEELMYKILEVINKLEQYFKHKGLKLNAKKTKYMLFFTSPENRTIKFENEVLKKTFLGLKINEQLNWDSQIDMTIKQLAPCIGMLKTTSKRTFYYYSTIHSILSYMAMIWGISTKTKINKIKR